MKNRSCSIVIPVFNEEGAIAQTIDELVRIISKISHFSFELICVNDGSSDQSGLVLSHLENRYQQLRVLTHGSNRGYGAALRTGLDAAESEWVFIVDADGTYPLEDLGKLLSEVDDEVAMVVGARKGIGIKFHPFKRIARWILRKMVHVLTGVMVPDLNSGMRVFKRSFYREFRHLLPQGFSFTTTITVAGLYAGYRIKYVSIEYAKRVGHSSIRPVQDFFLFVILIVRLASYFEPLRFFLPGAFLFFILGLLRALRDYLNDNSIGSLAVILFFLAIQIFISGILADVMVKRLSSKDKNSGV